MKMAVTAIHHPHTSLLHDRHELWLGFDAIFLSALSLLCCIAYFQGLGLKGGSKFQKALPSDAGCLDLVPSWRMRGALH